MKYKNHVLLPYIKSEGKLVTNNNIIKEKTIKNEKCNLRGLLKFSSVVHVCWFALPVVNVCIVISWRLWKTLVYLWQITTWASATETKSRKIHTCVFRLYFVVEEFQTYDKGINLLNSVERWTLICPDIGPHEPHHPAHVNESWSPSAERLKSSTAVWKEWGSLPNSIYNQNK